MKFLPCFQVDAFTDRPFAGNPAAVCPLEAWLPDALMQDIARENALSETAFFVKKGARFELRWFTPEVEVDLCGHATLASALIILDRLELGLTQVDFDSKSGPLSVKRQGGELVLDFPLDELRPIASFPELESVLGEKPVAVFQSRFTTAVLENAEAVRRLQPDLYAIARLRGVRALLITAAGDAASQADYVLRLFAPQSGIPEDPVTGSAQCSLAPYWAERLGKRRFRVRQLSARGGELGVALSQSRVLISGRAVLVKTGELLLPESALTA